MVRVPGREETSKGTEAPGGVSARSYEPGQGRGGRGVLEWKDPDRGLGEPGTPR